jgi:hypothetical protein
MMPAACCLPWKNLSSERAAASYEKVYSTKVIFHEDKMLSPNNEER